VPQLVGTPEQQAAAAVASAGLVPSTVLVLSDQPPGTVVAQDPAPDTEVASGGTVVLSVSRGSAELILSSAGDLVREGANGLEPVFQSAEIEEQPNASPATRLIAFRRGREGSIPGVAVSGQIWVIDPADPRTTYPLTNKGFDDRWPAISPDGRVVAFTSNRGGNPEDYDLCFVGIEEREAVPRCVADRDFAISRPAWSPDGRTIVARANQGETQVELVQYNSAVPSSGSQADWLAAGFVTDSMHGDRRGDVVLSSAFSPDGTRLAFAANWRDGTFKLYLAPFQNGVLGQAEPVTVVAACELAWRPDGVQIAVSQRSTDCSDKGRVVRLDLATPTTQQVVTPLGPDSGDPAWAFLG
jgi:Tol biopolymer transport system component